uniref:Uncharacterized protein n=1 Tax=Leersia perrieri TaxID=77586 RepID=A0A0D9VCC7_9ORYZ
MEQRGRYVPSKTVVACIDCNQAPHFLPAVDENSPVNLLLEIFSTCSGLPATDEFSSCRFPLRRLKLTSRMTMLPEDSSSAGTPPENELCDRLRRDKLVSSPRDGEICPSRPLEASNSSITLPSVPQIIPSQVQQFVLFCHDTGRPPFCDSPVRNLRRECFSCSVHEPTREMKDARPSLTPRDSVEAVGYDALEIFSTWSGRSGDEEFSSCSSPSRQLKLTSRMIMLLMDISSDGSPPESELYDRLSRDKLVQQSVLFFHDAARPPSCDSPVRNRRRECLSCSVHELTGEMKQQKSRAIKIYATPAGFVAAQRMWLHGLGETGRYGRVPLRLFIPTLSTLSMEQSAIAGETSPVSRLSERSSTDNEDVEARQRVAAGISPVKLLLLPSITTKFSMPSKEGRSPERALLERFRRVSPAMPVRDDGEMRPWSPRAGSETSVTVPCSSQVIPSHPRQQSVPGCHDAARPPSCDSPARNRRRELLSCSVQEMAGEMKVISSMRK